VLVGAAIKLADVVYGGKVILGEAATVPVSDAILVNS